MVWLVCTGSSTHWVLTEHSGSKWRVKVSNTSIHWFSCLTFRSTFDPKFEFKLWIPVSANELAYPNVSACWSLQRSMTFYAKSCGLLEREKRSQKRIITIICAKSKSNSELNSSANRWPTIVAIQAGPLNFLCVGRSSFGECGDGGYSSKIDA